MTYTLHKNTEDILMVMSLLCTIPDGVISSPEKINLLQHLMQDYHILVLEGKMQAFKFETPDLETEKDFREMISSLKELLMQGGIPFIENDKGELIVHVKEMRDKYEKGELDFQKWGND